METLTTHFHELYAEYEQKGLLAHQVTQQLERHLRKPVVPKTHTKRQWNSIIIIPLSTVGAILSVLGMFFAKTVWIMNSLETVKHSVQSQPCIVESNMFGRELTRPLFDCDVCANITQVDVVTNITQEEFAEKYAFTKVPVLIQGATRNWSAPLAFSFEFFKQLYTAEALQTTMERCQFFGYNTEFSSLQELFEMKPERAAFEPGQEPWYIGWSNCDGDVKEKLREHYSTPHFLPVNAEHSSLDWIFMGGPGNGAHVHLDHISMPSWQAQLSGEKTWYLLPVPECECTCHPLSVALHTGDIFVVDTNYWYHSTRIHPGKISITIGSEYN